MIAYDDSLKTTLTPSYSYTDVSYFHRVKNHALIFGFHAVYDRFREGQGSGGPVPRDESRRTFGGYVQDSFNVNEKLSLEAGFRLDHVRDYGTFALPRVSALYRFRTRPFWVMGVFGEKTFGKYSLFFNAENIIDTRQGRFGTVLFPPHQNPTFSEIYTHTEGRVFNGGIKIKF